MSSIARQRLQRYVCIVGVVAITAVKPGAVIIAGSDRVEGNRTRGEGEIGRMKS